MDENLARKAHAEREAKRKSKDPQSSDGMWGRAAEHINNCEDIREAASSDSGSIVNSLKSAAAEEIKTKGFGRFVKAVKRVITRGKSEKSAEEGKDRLIEKVGEVSITGISAWLYKTYRDLSLLSFPPMALLNWTASLIGWKCKLIVLTLTKVKGEIYVGIAVHKAVATPVGLVLTIASYILMWKLIRINMKALKVVFKAV